MPTQRMRGVRGRNSPLTAAVAAMAVLAVCAASAPAKPEPIRIGVGVTVVPGVYDAKSMYDAGVGAALAYINDRGGWGSRGVKIDWCVSPGDPASDTKCYRQFVSDKVTAVMGILAGSASIGYPMMQAAGIPSFMVATSAADDESEWQHGFSGSATGAFTTPARFACSRGYKSVAVVHDDTATYRSLYQKYAAPILRRCGISATEVVVPYGTPDASPYIQKAVSGDPDLLVPIITAPANTVVDMIATAHYPISKTFMAPILSENFFQNPNAVGVILAFGWNPRG